jgi:hypothetical protein
VTQGRREVECESGWSGPLTRGGRAFEVRVASGLGDRPPRRPPTRTPHDRERIGGSRLKSLVRDMDDKLAEARDGRVALVDVSGVPRMLKDSSWCGGKAEG